MHPTYPTTCVYVSPKVDGCKPLPAGRRRRAHAGVSAGQAYQILPATSHHAIHSKNSRVQDTLDDVALDDVASNAWQILLGTSYGAI